MTEDTLAGLAAATEAVALARRLELQLAAARQRAESSAAEVAGAADRLAEEERDVARLGSTSWASVLASVKGTRDDDLRREQAEVLDARVAAGHAESRHRQDLDAVASLERRRHELGDTAAALRAAQQARHDWLATHDTERGPRLTAIAEEDGRLAAEQRELGEALESGTAAFRLLQDALGTLGSAGSWSTWDTFGGGGMLTDLVKYDRLAQVGRELERAGAALRHFDAELADVHLPAVGALEVGSWEQTFDVFFDNFFTDWSVRGRIAEAERSTARALEHVSAAGRRLGARQGEVEARRAALATEREALLS